MPPPRKTKNSAKSCEADNELRGASLPSSEAVMEVWRMLNEY